MVTHMSVMMPRWANSASRPTSWALVVLRRTVLAMQPAVLATLPYRRISRAWVIRSRV